MVEVFITAILKIVFVIVGGHIAITKVVPLLNDFLLSFINDKKAVDSFTSLIDIFILVTVGTLLVGFLIEVNNVYLNYISVIKPGLDVLNGLFVYIQWILLALIVVVAIKNFKK